METLIPDDPGPPAVEPPRGPPQVAAKLGRQVVENIRVVERLPDHEVSGSWFRLPRRPMGHAVLRPGREGRRTCRTGRG